MNHKGCPVCSSELEYRSSRLDDGFPEETGWSCERCGFYLGWETGVYRIEIAGEMYRINGLWEAVKQKGSPWPEFIKQARLAWRLREKRQNTRQKLYDDRYRRWKKRMGYE